MNSQKKLAKIFCLTDLLITELDDGLTEQANNLKNKAQELLNLLEPINEQFYSGAGSKTTLFIELQNKFNYNFDKVYKK
jgi:hypothetical protein